MFDVNAIFKIIENGGPSAIFLLLIFFSLLLTGTLRLKREVEGLEKLNNELLARVDKQQALFERSLDLLERQVLPLQQEQGARGRKWASEP